MTINLYFDNIVTVKKNYTKANDIGDNMINSELLHKKIKEKGFNCSSFSKEIQMSKSSFSQRMNGKINFSISDVKRIIKVLNLTYKDTNDIFFTL